MNSNTQYRLLHTLKGHHGSVYGLAFSPDGRWFASGGTDAAVRLWDIYGGKCCHVLQKHSDEVRFLKFDPNGNILATGGFDKWVSIWDVSSGGHIRKLGPHGSFWFGYVKSLHFSPTESNLLLIAGGRKISVWNVESGAKETEWKPKEGFWGECDDMCVTPDGRFVISFSGSELRMWSTDGWKDEGVLPVPKDRARVIDGVVLKLAARPNTSHVLMFGLGELMLIDVISKDVLWRVDEGPIFNTSSGASFSVDGNLLAIACLPLRTKVLPKGNIETEPNAHGVTRLLNSVTGAKVGEIDVNCGIHTVAISPDGHQIAQGCSNGDIRVWQIL